jgi:hypothetical protein
VNAETTHLGGASADRSPSPKEIEAGKNVASELSEHYNVGGILIKAAQAGYITELRCEMTFCFAHDRRGFDPLDPAALGPWMPTHEHFPLAKRYRGKTDVTNAVLAHRRCNNVGYKIEELLEHLKAMRLADGTSLRAEAIAAAIADHIEQRGHGEGRYPRSSGARKRAVTVALLTQESFVRPALHEDAG